MKFALVGLVGFLLLAGHSSIHAESLATSSRSVIVFLGDPTDAPDPFGAQPATPNQLSLELGVALTGELSALQKDPSKPTSSHYFVEIEEKVATGASPVVTLTRSVELRPPFVIRQLSPGGGAGNGAYIVVATTVDWNGLTGGGAQVPDGVYGTTVQARFVRVRTVNGQQVKEIDQTELRSGSVTVDRASPVLTLSPADGAFLKAGVLTLSAGYADAGGGIQASSFVAFLDQQNVSSQFAVGASSASWTLSSALADGSHSFRVRIQDTAGNIAEVTHSFFMDTHSPAVTLSPAQESATTDSTPVLEAILGDPSPSSGFDSGSFHADLDGQDVSSSFQILAGTASWTPAQPLPQGSHTLSVQVKDQAGNEGSATTSFLVDTVPPLLSASPSHGSLLTDASPTLLATYADPDPGSGVLQSSFQAILDGQDRSSSFTVDPLQARFLISDEFPLSDGPHVLTFRVQDRAHNETEVTSEFTVETTKPPTVNLTADQVTIVDGQSVTLTWESTDATSATLEPGVGSVPTSGSLLVSPRFTTTYQIIVTGPRGMAADEITVTVTPLGTSVELMATPPEITPGTSTTLSWTSVDGIRAYIQPGIGEVPLEGSVTVSPSHSTQYTITVIGSSGVGTDQVLVKTLGNPFPPQAGSFGYKYRELIPEDATILSYDKKQFSIITGVIQNHLGSPLQDVLIRVQGQPEYGTSLTGSDGRYSIPVNGGKNFTVTAEKPGFISIQRTVEVPWNDIALVDTVRMLAEESVATTMPLDGNPGSIFVHRNQGVTDSLGHRSCSVVFTGDTIVTLLDEYGIPVTTLPTITVRATEYPTPESMPAVLPPNSGFTYCAELKVDGAERVRFSKPVVIWVDNFLHFPVGMAVPVGTYDRDTGFWIPSDNGAVVKLLDTNADGLVDSLDSNGDGLPNDLDSDGLFNDEVVGLQDAQAYVPNSTYWRTELLHFTPGDLNWPFSLPPNATPPNPSSLARVQEQQTAVTECQTGISSMVEERSQILHEDIPITGTGFTLHYSSGRTQGYKSKISVPASGSTIPAGLLNIDVFVRMAGLEFHQAIPASPNQTAEFVWNGRDFLGNPVGYCVAQIAIGFEYDTLYGVPADVRRSFELAPLTSSLVANRQRAWQWKRYSVPIHRFDTTSPSSIAPGWTFSANHHHDPRDFRLYLGSGSFTEDGIPTIQTIAGTGAIGFSGDGGPATMATFRRPHGSGIDSAGNYYICDRDDNRIRKIDSSGIITTFAGNGLVDTTNTPAGRGDGTLAIQARLGSPHEIVFDKFGNAYVPVTSANRGLIRKIDANGIITTVAGGSTCTVKTPSTSGDGGSATLVGLCSPFDIELDNSGNLYIAELVTHEVVRKLDPSGIIQTVAGNYNTGFSADGGLAVQSRLQAVQAIALDSDGALYLADQGTRRLRKVSVDGIIRTIAGTGQSPTTPVINGQLATTVKIHPFEIALDRKGNIYVLDELTRILKIDSNGFATTVLGSISGFSGDDGPAALARISANDIDIDPNGDLLITDAGNRRVRKVKLPSVSLAGLAPDDLVYTDPAGLGFVVNGSGLHTRTVDLLTGKVLLQFSHDPSGRLLQVTDLHGNTTVLQRDASGLVRSIVSPDGISTTLEHDPDGMLGKVFHPGGGFHQFEYTDDGLMNVETKPNGDRYQRTFDSAGRLTEIDDQEGGHWELNSETTATGLVVASNTTAEGNVTTYQDSTDSSGNFASTITGPDGGMTQYSEPVTHLSSTKVTPCGMTLSSSYTVNPQFKFRMGSSLTTKLESPLQKAETLVRTYADTNADGRPDIDTITSTINGKASILRVDLNDSSSTLVSPLGRTASTYFDPSTLLTTRVVVPGLNEVSYGYWSDGRIHTVTSADRSTTVDYHASGLPRSVTDALSRNSSMTYNAAHRLSEVTRPDLTRVKFDTDDSGNLLMVTTPLLKHHKFTYTAVGLTKSYTTPTGMLYGYTYDRDRRPRVTTMPSGRQLELIYEGAMVGIIRTPEVDIGIDYLCSSKIGTLTKGPETVGYSYDGPLVTRVTQQGTINQVLSCTYNNDFRVSAISYAGATESIVYDNDGLLTSSGSFTIWRNPQNGLPTSLTDGVFTRTSVFNGFGEVESVDTSLAGQSIADMQLSRNRACRIEIRRETIGGVTTEFRYTYDLLDRLDTVKINGTVVEDYDYDDNGRRVSEVNALRGIPGRTFTYNDDDQVLTAGDESFTWHVDGFLQTRATPTQGYGYTYSTRGELLAVTRTDGTLIQYITDPLGRRIAKKVNGVLVEKYLWAGRTGLLAVFNGQDQVLARFEGAKVVLGGVPYYLITDQVGSIRAVTDASGNIVREVTRDSFGNILSDSNPALNCYIGFAGGLEDRDTGLVLFGYRDYLPAIGRWTARDPLLLGGGSYDLYEYCGQDPINCRDKNGLWFWIAASVAFELALSAADIISAYNTVNNPCASTGEKAMAVTLAAAGVFLPGGGAAAGGRAAKGLPELRISASKYPELAENIWHAQQAGHPNILTHGGNRLANRAEALDGIPDISGFSRDEYPFASSMEGGAGAWVGHVPPSQQSAQGALIRNFVQSNGILPGDQYIVTVVH